MPEIKLAETLFKNNNIAISDPKRIVIIGAGPSGLAASCFLASQGHDVTVIEKNSFFGGRVHRESWRDIWWEAGATWFHDSNHPAVNALKDGGVPQEHNGIWHVEEGFDKITKSLIVNPLNKKLYYSIIVILHRHSIEVINLSWDELLDQVLDEPNSYIELPEYVLEIKEKLNSIWARRLIDVNDKALAKQQLKKILEEDEVDTNKDSVLASKYYQDYHGDRGYLPISGLSQIIDHLVNEAKKYDVKFKMKTSVEEINYNNYSSATIVTDKGSYEADEVIVAIAVHDYSSIKRSDSELDKTKASLDNLEPKGMSRIVVVLEQEVFLNRIVKINFKGIKVELTTQAKSQVVYMLVHNSDVNKLEKNPEYIKQIIEQVLLENRDLTKIEVLKHKIYYKDGNSWYIQQKGFSPVDNLSGSIVKYLGVLTGADDSVHTSITSALKTVGAPSEFIYDLFPQQPLAERVAMMFYRGLRPKAPENNYSTDFNDKGDEESLIRQNTSRNIY